MDLEFRQAKATDIQQLVEFLADDEFGAGREDLSLPLNQRYLEAFQSFQNDPNIELVVAEISGRLAGTFQLTFIPSLTRTGSWRCLIEGVRLGRTFRGEGLGIRLIEWAIGRARERGCSIVQLTSDKRRA